MKRKLIIPAALVLVVVGLLKLPLVPDTRAGAAPPPPGAFTPIKFANGAAEVIKQSQKLTLYSLFPRPSFGYDKRAFHDYKILGQMPLVGTGRETILRQLHLLPSPAKPALAVPRISAYEALFVRPPVKPVVRQIGLACFMPRHGLRAVHNGRTIDLLICFQCGHTYVYEGEEKIDQTSAAKSQQPAFDNLLKAAKVPLPTA